MVPRNEQIRGFASDSLLDNILESIHTPREMKENMGKLFNPNSPVELAIVILDASLSSEELARDRALVPTLSKVMSSLPSFYHPYVVIPGGAMNVVLNATKKFQEKGGMVYHFGDLSAILKSAPKFLDKITSFSEIAPSFSDSKTDLLIIHVDRTSAEKRLRAIDGALRIYKPHLPNTILPNMCRCLLV